jgi:hypothetical protein
VKVRYNEGVAIHIGPEPCIVGREVRDEASAGERTGQPLSRGAPGRPAGGRRCKSVTVKE